MARSVGRMASLSWMKMATGIPSGPGAEARFSEESAAESSPGVTKGAESALATGMADRASATTSLMARHSGESGFSIGKKWLEQ